MRLCNYEHGRLLISVGNSLWSAGAIAEHGDILLQVRQVENYTFILTKQIHWDYLKAGSDVISTATYQVYFSGFAAKGIAREGAVELMKKVCGTLRLSMC